SLFSSFFTLLPRPPRSTLFPYTTLFRSGVAHPGVALHVKPGSSPRSRTAEPDALNAKLADNVVEVGILLVPAHHQPGKGDAGDIDHARADHACPGDAAMLGEIVVKRTEARQVLRHEPIFATQRVTPSQTVRIGKGVIHPYRALVVAVEFVAIIKVVVAVWARAEHGGRAHHRHAAPNSTHAHPHTCIRQGHVLLEE